MQQFLTSIFGKQSLHLFSQMAETVTSEYIDELTNNAVINGTGPSFNEIMNKIKSLNNDLSLKFVWLTDNYKIQRGYKSARLTRGCKKVIEKSVQDYLRTAKLIDKTRHYRPSQQPAYIQLQW